LNPWGEIVQEEWFRSADIRQEIVLHRDEFVIMPNHVHGIVWIVPNGDRGDRGNGRGDRDGGRGDRPGAPTSAITPIPPGPARRSLASFLAGFKSVVTKRINTLREAPGVPVWQRNYYEHIIRDERALGYIREYILNNPARWETDENNPALSSRRDHRR